MSQYSTIHTAYGLAKMSLAESDDTPITITHVVVGDGNGNDVTPDVNMTSLVRERFRAPIGRSYRDVNTPNMFTVEVTIPADEGGFTLREIGVLDSDGGLIVVGNLPTTYKPTPADGAYSDTILAYWEMRSGRNLMCEFVDDTDILAYWEMRSGRNDRRHLALQHPILAYWEMRSGRN